MNKLKEPIFFYDGITSKCIIKYGKQEFVGEATCHPEDMDFVSEKTGSNIAYLKAQINFYKYLRDSNKPKVNALREVVALFEQSGKTNKKSYEYRLLYRQYYLAYVDYKTSQFLLETKKRELREYLYQKEKLHKQIRLNRNKSKEKDTNK